MLPCSSRDHHDGRDGQKNDPPHHQHHQEREEEEEPCRKENCPRGQAGIVREIDPRFLAWTNSWRARRQQPCWHQLEHPIQYEEVNSKISRIWFNSLVAHEYWIDSIFHWLILLEFSLEYWDIHPNLLHFSGTKLPRNTWSVAGTIWSSFWCRRKRSPVTLDSLTTSKVQEANVLGKDSMSCMPSVATWVKVLFSWHFQTLDIHWLGKFLSRTPDKIVYFNFNWIIGLLIICSRFCFCFSQIRYCKTNEKEVLAAEIGDPVFHREYFVGCDKKIVARAEEGEEEEENQQKKKRTTKKRGRGERLKRQHISFSIIQLFSLINSVQFIFKKFLFFLFQAAEAELDEREENQVAKKKKKKDQHAVSPAAPPAESSGKGPSSSAGPSSAAGTAKRGRPPAESLGAGPSSAGPSPAAETVKRARGRPPKSSGSTPARKGELSADIEPFHSPVPSICPRVPSKCYPEICAQNIDDQMLLLFNYITAVFISNLVCSRFFEKCRPVRIRRDSVGIQNDGRVACQWRRFAGWSCTNAGEVQARRRRAASEERWRVPEERGGVPEETRGVAENSGGGAEEEWRDAPEASRLHEPADEPAPAVGGEWWYELTIRFFFNLVMFLSRFDFFLAKNGFFFKE